MKKIDSIQLERITAGADSCQWGGFALGLGLAMMMFPPTAPAGVGIAVMGAGANSIYC